MTSVETPDRVAKPDEPPVGAVQRSRARVRWVAAGVLVAVAVVLPFLPVPVPIVFDGTLDSPGVLHLLSLMCVMGAVAMTYDLLFGFTGLLSFGHGLYVALGMYTTAVVLSATDLGLGAAVLVVLVLGLAVPLTLGAVCLRVSGIAFAMVTLAFAQAGSIFVLRDPFDITGGELGLVLDFAKLPDRLVGVFNAQYRYWLALALLLVVVAVVRWSLNSRPGRAWQAIRDNEQRVAVLGLRPYTFKLMVFVLASFLATVAGAVYAVIVGGAHAEVTKATFTLGLLVMVVLGGTGRPYGAVVGGLVYTYLTHRLGALSTATQDLPAPVEGALGEPLLILGTMFVLLVLFLPGGLVSIARLRGPGVVDRLRAALGRANA